MSLAMVRSAREKFTSQSAQKNRSSVKDRALQEAIANAEQSIREFSELRDFVRTIGNIPTNRLKHYAARMMNFLVPQRFQSKLPQFMSEMIAEEMNELEAYEMQYRKRLNNVQEATKNLTRATREKGEENEQLRQDIEGAREERWNSRQIHEYMLEKIGLPVDEEIAQLLDDKFNVLTKEEKEDRRQRMLKQLDGNVSEGRKVVVMGVKSCYVCLEGFESGAGELFNFVNVYKPISAMRDASRTLVETSNIMYAGRDAITETINVTVRGFENALDAVRKCRDHSIISADMEKLIETGNARIDAKLKLLLSEDKKRLAAVSSASNTKQLESNNVIDIQPIAN